MPMLRIAGCAGASGTFAERNGTALEHQVRIQGGITASILLFVPSPSHGLISLVPWEPTASVADLETAAVNSPRILTCSRTDAARGRPASVRGDNNGCSKGLRSNSVTGSLAPRQNRSPCRPHPPYPFHPSGCAAQMETQCAPTARITSGGGFHPESCRLLR